MALIDRKIALPSTGGGTKKNGTPVITGTNTYGDYFGSGAQPQNALFTKEMIQQRFAEDEEKWQKLPYIINGNNSLVGGSNNLVKPFNASQYFDGSVVGTVSGGVSGGNKGGVTGTGAGASTGTSETGGGTSTTTDTGTMTYEQYIAEEKAREEEKRQAALKEAEINKERAAADAQASYMQNMSTYGVNAETMAQMGLTGGGYSDYLNAQAYAQKRGDLQAADRNELVLKQQAETTYDDNIAALNEDLFTYQETQKTNKQTGYNTLLGYAMDADSGITEETIRAMAKNIGLSEEEIQSIINTMNTAQSTAKGEYANNALTALIADLQNPNAYGNYSEAGIRALGKQWGWTDEQIQQAVDIWNGTKGATEELLKEEEDTSQYGAQAFISAIQNGAYTGTREELYETCLQNRNAGYMTEEDVAQVMKEYDQKMALDDGKVSKDVYYNATNGDASAQTALNNALNPEQLQQETKEKLKELYASVYGQPNPYIPESVKVVDTNTGVVDYKTFNSDIGSNNRQKDYWDTLKAEINNVQPGQIIMPNYGAQGNSKVDEYYMCISPGVFVSVGTMHLGKIENHLYVPAGYKYENGKIKKA